MIQKFWGFWFRYLMFWPQNYVDQGCVLVSAVPVFTYNFCVFLSYHTLLCFCVRILCVCFCVPMILFLWSNVLCVCFYVKSALYVFLCSRTVPIFLSPCTLCVIKRTLYVFLSSHTLCVFPVFPYPACLAQQMKQLSGDNFSSPAVPPGKK